MLSVVLRSLSSVVVGLLLVVYKDAVMPFIVPLIGVAFVLPGLVSIGVRLFAARDGEIPLISIGLITSLGSVAFGMWLLFAPAFFVAILMSMLGVALLLAGAFQIVTLVRLRRYDITPSIYYYVMPCIIVLLGIFILVNPSGTASLSFWLIGIGAVLAGVSGFMNWLLMRKNDAGG